VDWGGSDWRDWGRPGVDFGGWASLGDTEGPTVNWGGRGYRAGMERAGRLGWAGETEGLGGDRDSRGK